ncbi:unnamed protein product [Caenorhabditis sp. 36 PRJEB53466]|nr:unnamed protein product [Caenorhabditis sp. 36 PRJEB53466]
MNTYCLLIVLFIIRRFETAPLTLKSSENSTECPIEKIEKIGDCVQNLMSTVESITKWVDQEYKFDTGEKKEFQTKCEEAQKCFASVKSSCPDFPDSVNQEVSVMCSRFTFIIDKFTDCVPKLDKLTEIACVNEVFGPDSMKKSGKEKCQYIKKNRECARLEVEKNCGQKMAAVLDENFDEELKLKCTATVHDFQNHQAQVDGDHWLEPQVSKVLNKKCDEAKKCLRMLEDCSVFEDDDILWLEDFCDSYGFLTGAFHSCAVKIDKNFKDPCVQHYLVNSPYFMLDESDRCDMLKNDGRCLKRIINSTCSPDFAADFQELLGRQMTRLDC